MKLSIIVPVYNVEKYLPMCLDSIRMQTYKDIEIICVNDGSTDRSGDILNLYREADSRIVIINKDNGGLSSARNAGLRTATGQVVCFVDSDDLVEKNMAARVVEVFEQTRADVVTFGGKVYPDFRNEPWLEGALSPRDVEYDEFTPDILVEEASQPFAWRTACRLKFLIGNHLFFDEEIRFGEDKLFQYAVYPRSGKTVFISDKLYLYRVGRKDSLMSSRGEDSYLKLYDHLRIVSSICKNWKEGGFIDKYSESLLLQIAEFVLGDVANAPHEHKTILANFLEAILTTYFSEEQLDLLIQDEGYGQLAKGLLQDRASGFDDKKFRETPVGLLRRFWYWFPLFRPVIGLARWFGAHLPMSRTRLNQRFAELARQVQETEWEAAESHSMSDSLRLLQIETGLKISR